MMFCRSFPETAFFYLKNPLAAQPCCSPAVPHASTLGKFKSGSQPRATCLLLRFPIKITTQNGSLNTIHPTIFVKSLSYEQQIASNEYDRHGLGKMAIKIMYKHKHECTSMGNIWSKYIEEWKRGPYEAVPMTKCLYENFEG
ncbi:hypothetical protein T03_18043 [Trichinella britovi]|uniref:Uncharacterized protein n=1 Tax=Trichinella britovi TaxID=45882 RepID=A0A0V1D8F5_TRIBR|nr:hypothetical protein T03_18043 [Trichinella britovi]